MSIPSKKLAAVFLLSLLLLFSGCAVKKNGLSGVESEDYFGWVEVEGDGSFRVGDVSSSDAAAAVESLKAGNFRGNSEFMSGSWARQSDGSFVLTSYGNAVTFQYRR